jgi:hypothetical protein
MVDALSLQWLLQHFHFGTSMPVKGGGVHSITSDKFFKHNRCPLTTKFPGLAVQKMLGYQEF